jgi:hypothetical protein
LHQWVNNTFGGLPNSHTDSQGGPRLASAIRYPTAPGHGDYLTVRKVTEQLRNWPDAMLDAVDAVLHLEDIGEDNVQL